MHLSSYPPRPAACAAPVGPLVVRGLLALGLLIGALAAASRADAAGTPNLALSVQLPARGAGGRRRPVSRSRPRCHSGRRRGPHIAYRVVLPGGSSYVLGSADAAAGGPDVNREPAELGQDGAVWRNVGDVPDGGAHALHFAARPSSTYGVNTTFSLSAEAYASDDARWSPAFTAAGLSDGTAAHPATASDTGRTPRARR